MKALRLPVRNPVDSSKAEHHQVMMQPDTKAKLASENYILKPLRRITSQRLRGYPSQWTNV